MQNRRVVFQVILFVVILLISYIGYLRYPSLYEIFEYKLNDLMLTHAEKRETDKNIIIIDIDEKSLKELGQWPWSRDKVSKILQNLANLGVAIVGLDVVFAEYDNSSPKKVLKELGMESKNAKDYDEILSQTIANTPTIVGYVFSFSNDNIKDNKRPKNSAIIIEKNKPQKSYLLKPKRAILNIPPIQKAAYSNGYFNTIPDSDGVVRSIPMLMDYRGILYPSLTLEIIRIALGERKIIVNYYENGVDSIQIGNLTIPTDQFGRMMIKYKGVQFSYRYISATDIYHNRIKQDEIKGKVALLGTSAAGLLDLRSTPFDSVYPGVEIHATALDNMLNQDFLTKPYWIIGADLADITVFLILGFIITLIPSSIISFLLFLILIYGLYYFHLYMMNTQGIILNTFFPLFALILLFLVAQVINYFLESRQKEKIKKKFASKVSPAVVEELIKNAKENTLEGKEEIITIFFSDIRSFTTISEELGSAKELISLLNQYMTPMVDIITQHKGTVDKFIGDAIMAYWNAPLKVPNHADEALKASIEQIFALKNLNIKLAKENKPNIDIGIGLNSGKSIVGEMGSSGRSDYTCIGDPVNLASRAEGLCKPYGAKIILTQFTKELLQDDIYFLRELDIVRVKGKEKPVTIFECMGYKDNYWLNFKDSSDYYKALNLYREANFDEALKIFNNLYSKSSQKLYELYIERCEYYIKNYPENFDGVFTFKTK